MGQHAIYVWSAYGIVVFGMAVLFTSAYIAYRKSQKHVEDLKSDREEDA